MCICMWEYVHVSAGLQRVLDPLETELQVILSCPTWVLETKISTMFALNGSAVSLALECLLMGVILKR